VDDVVGGFVVGDVGGGGGGSDEDVALEGIEIVPCTEDLDLGSIGEGADWNTAGEAGGRPVWVSGVAGCDGAVAMEEELTVISVGEETAAGSEDGCHRVIDGEIVGELEG